MLPSSAKGKGRRHQQRIRKMLIEHFNLQADDVINRSMGSGGEDLIFSPQFREQLPISIEAKCQQTLNIWAAIEQAKENSNGYIPVVIFAKNRTTPKIVLEFSDFLKLIKPKNDSN